MLRYFRQCKDCLLYTSYADKAQWQAKAEDLAGRFVKNFEKYATNAEGKALIAAGPKA